MKFSINRAFFAMILLLGLAACAEPAKDNKATGKTVDTTPQAMIVGVIKDKDSEKLLAGVSVTAGNTNATSDDKGQFEIKFAASESQTVILTKEGYVPKKIVQKIPSDKNKVEVSYELIKADVSFRGPATADIYLLFPDKLAQISIPQNSLERTDGKPIAGDVNVSATKIIPAQNPKMMPGGYGIVGGGFMESFGALTMYLQDDSGAELQLSAGRTATIRIPASTRGQLENEMPVFFYDVQQNGWIEVGMAQLDENNTGGYFDVEIDRIGAWNIDKAMNLIEVSGCVNDSAGNPVANALVSADGINYSSITTTTTDANGNFAVPVREYGQLYILAQSGALMSNAIPIEVKNQNTKLVECLVVSAQQNSFTAKLTWGARPLDVDSHLFTPDGHHIYFSNKGTLTREPFANLDVDDRYSYGPEVVTVRKMMVGTYEYWVHNYSRTSNPALTGSPIRVELAGATGVHVFAPPAGEKNGDTSVHLFDVTVDQNCNATVKPVNEWSNKNLLFLQDSTSVPEYCTPAN